MKLKKQKMNKLVLLFLFLFTRSMLYGQIKDKGVILRVDGGYDEQTTTNLLTTINTYEAKEKGGNISVSVGLKRDNWVFGLGFQYAASKASTLGMNRIEEDPRDPTANVYYFEGDEASIKIPSGKIFASYYLPIFGKFYFTPAFYVGYGKSIFKEQVNFNVITYLPVEYSYDPLSYSAFGTTLSVRQYEIKKSTPYFYLQLAPEFSYFFSNTFSLNLQLGGASFEIMDGDWDNHQKRISFSPKYWKLGATFCF